MNQIHGETHTAQPAQGRVAEPALQARREHDGDGHALGADVGPVADLMRAFGKDVPADAGDEAGPAGPFPVVGGEAGDEGAEEEEKEDEGAAEEG